MFDIHKVLKNEGVIFTEILEYCISKDNGYVIYSDIDHKLIKLHFDFHIFCEYKNNTLVYMFNKQFQFYLPQK